MNKSVLFVGPSGNGKSYLANIKFNEKIDSTVGIEYNVYKIGKTKYTIYDTGDFERYYFIIKDYFPKVNEIYLFVKTKEELDLYKKKIEPFHFKIISDNIELFPDFLLTFTPSDITFYKDELEDLPLLYNPPKNKFGCCSII